MRKLFDINEDIRQALEELEVDEDGVVVSGDLERISALKLEREEKLEAVALYWKELNVEAEALKKESEVLLERARIALKQADGLKMYLSSNLNGEPFKTSRTAITYRKSEAVIIDEELLPKEYFVKKITEAPDKKKIKELLKEGKTIKGAELETRSNIQIK